MFYFTLFTVADTRKVNMHVFQRRLSQTLFYLEQDGFKLGIGIESAAAGVPVRQVQAERYGFKFFAEFYQLLNGAELASLAGYLRPDTNSYLLARQLVQYFTQVFFHRPVYLFRRPSHIKRGMEDHTFRPAKGSDARRLQDTTLTGPYLLHIVGVQVNEVGGVCGQPHAGTYRGLTNQPCGCLSHLHSLDELYLHTAQPQFRDTLNAADR
jgi:hypothetical protein